MYESIINVQRPGEPQLSTKRHSACSSPNFGYGNAQHSTVPHTTNTKSLQRECRMAQSLGRWSLTVQEDRNLLPHRTLMYEKVRKLSIAQVANWIARCHRVCWVSVPQQQWIQKRNGHGNDWFDCVTGWEWIVNGLFWLLRSTPQNTTHCRTVK